MNQQAPEKPVKSELLVVHSIFYTIQGEGPFCGVPAVFVRLAGCNLQCPACDTDYTSTREAKTASEILEAIQVHQPGGLVVITGGEPFRQDLTRLLNLLVEADYYVQVETNGTLPPPELVYSYNPSLRTGIYVVCSPKTGRVHPKTAEAACCYKYVLSAVQVGGDGLPMRALHHPAAPFLARPPVDFRRPIYLQPEDTKDNHLNERNLRAVIASCMKYGYTLQLQVHKLINME